MSFFFQQPFHYQQPYQQYYQTPSPFGSPFGNHPQQQQYGYQSPPHNHYYESSDDDEREGVEHQLVQLSDGSLVLRPISNKKNTHTQRTQHQLEQERLYEKQRQLGLKQQQQQRLHEQRQREEAQLEAQERIRQQQQKEQEDLLRSLFGCYNKRQPQQTQQTQPTRQPTKPQQTTKPTVNTSQPKPNTTTQKPSQQHTKPTTPNPINTNLTPVLSPLPQKKTNTKFTTTVSDEVEDETHSDCNGQCDDDSYDPYDINSPLIIDVPAPELIITEQTDDKVETPTSQIEKKLKVEQLTPEPTSTTQQELPLEVPITATIHKRNEEHIKTETPIEESNQSKIDLEVNNANEALLTRLFEQTERLYNKRSLLLTKIKSLGPQQQQQYSTSLQKNLKQLDALIEQTHKYTQELLDSDDLV